MYTLFLHIHGATVRVEKMAIDVCLLFKNIFAQQILAKFKKYFRKKVQAPS